jgi:3-phenylpropionate/trans-cinnamate dioxygenase ferredoxin reductase subunit
MDFENVFLLRTHKDQEQIKDAVKKAKSIVIIGGGFIGTEAASSLKMELKDGAEVHLISSEELPLSKCFGTDVAKMFKSEHEKNGIILHLKSKVTEIKGSGCCG